MRSSVQFSPVERRKTWSAASSSSEKWQHNRGQNTVVRKLLNE